MKALVGYGCYKEVPWFPNALIGRHSSRPVENSGPKQIRAARNVRTRNGVLAAHMSRRCTHPCLNGCAEEAGNWSPRCDISRVYRVLCYTDLWRPEPLLFRRTKTGWLVECIDLMRLVTRLVLVHEFSWVLWFWPIRQAWLFLIVRTAKRAGCGFIVSLQSSCGSVCGVCRCVPFW